MKQRVTDSLMEGIYQQAAQGNIEIAAELLNNMSKESVDLNEVVSKLLENLQQEQQVPEQPGLPQQQGGLPPEAANLPSLGALGIGG